jgi:hypothetical protein
LIKPDRLASHDWHVQPNCQRSGRPTHLSGVFWIEITVQSTAVLELVALDSAVFRLAEPFLRELFKTIGIRFACQPLTSADRVFSMLFSFYVFACRAFAPRAKGCSLKEQRRWNPLPE